MSPAQKRAMRIAQAKKERYGDIAPDIDWKAVKAIYALSKRMTMLTGQPYEVDHVIPIAKGGMHHQDNLVVMRKDFNRVKRDYVIDELIAFFAPNAVRRGIKVEKPNLRPVEPEIQTGLIASILGMPVRAR